MNDIPELEIKPKSEEAKDENGPIEIKIEKGIPIPPPTSQGNVKYPWREMEVGDSFFVSAKTPKDCSRMQSGFGASWKRFKPMKFTSRIENEGAGVRVWRIE